MLTTVSFPCAVSPAHFSFSEEIFRLFRPPPAAPSRRMGFYAPLDNVIPGSEGCPSVRVFEKLDVFREICWEIFVKASHLLLCAE